LGYFSGHKSVNLDGLANNYEFFEDVLKKNKTGEYMKNWDYVIDAFVVDNNSMKTAFPQGCFVPLPSDIQNHPFLDGDNTRKLAVFQMHSNGIIDCTAIKK
jgi:hypothetical protein